MKSILFTTFFALLISQLYSQKNKTPPSGIIGGQEVQANQFPWMGTIVMSDEGLVGCGATLIAPQWVLTAAHCVELLSEPPANDKVLLNSLVQSVDNLESYSELINIEAIYSHEGFEVDPTDPDIALLRLAEPSNISPILLAEESDSPYYANGEPARVLGWGLTESEGSDSDVLLTAEPIFFGETQCSDFYALSQSENPFDLIDHGLVCAGYTASMNPAGAASGDSGCPLFFEDDEGNYKQVGIVAYGEGDITTENFPGIFTKVPHHRMWLDSIMNLYDQSTPVVSIEEEGLSLTYYANNLVKINQLDKNSHYIFSITDLSGRTINTINTINIQKTQSSFEFDVSSLEPNLYILTIHNISKGLFVNQKIFVQ